MEIDPQLIEWLKCKMEETGQGDVGIIMHIRQGEVAWVEKVCTTTEKPRRDDGKQ